ncbi:hypothetical protein LCGC14_1732110 [marine sediment metagenome]|uniref:Uncharacterized protein n=1 Tax=marine sediment metagenome TaxID=412755 RepID=A0A0F9H987_9ZZZZ
MRKAHIRFELQQHAKVVIDVDKNESDFPTEEHCDIDEYLKSKVAKEVELNGFTILDDPEYAIYEVDIRGKNEKQNSKKGGLQPSKKVEKKKNSGKKGK